MVITVITIIIIKCFW